MPNYDDYDQETKIAVIGSELGYVKEKLNAVDRKLTDDYIIKDEFIPIKNIVYGLVTLILIAVVGALIALVVGNGTI